MIAVFAMTFLALMLALVFGVPVVMAQTDTIPQEIAAWAAGFELWILAGVSIVLVGVYGWLILYALANRERLVRLESWREAIEERLNAGKGTMEDLRGDVCDGERQAQRDRRRHRVHARSVRFRRRPVAGRP